MKVLHLISSGGMYGAENVVGALTHDLNQMGYPARIGLFDNAHCPQNDVANRFQARGLTVTQIPCCGRVERKAIQMIREIVRSDEIDVVHTHGYKADIYGYLAARRLALPLVATCHGSLWTRQTLAIHAYEFLDALFLRHFQAVVTVSDVIAQEARSAGVVADKITTIYNGIDLSAFASASPTLLKEIKKEDNLLIGTVGRLIPLKGVDYFLRAARQVLATFPKVIFVVVGEGPARGKLERLAKDLAIDQNVVFTGMRADMADVYASLDIFVLASLDEGAPMVILEAMASGRPVIATEVGAVPKLVVSGESGMLVQAGDVEGLAKALLSLIRNPELRKRLARNGEIFVHRQFSSRIMSHKYVQLYERLLEGNARALDAVSVTDLRV
jgi:glycosyltransferase involved in cell wall biosynthesis